MKTKTLIIVLIAVLSGCGYSSRDNETIGQVKKAIKVTPLICPDRYEADVSLGVMQNGVGSMSHEDLYLLVPDKENFKKLEDAVTSGVLVNIHYNKKRFRICGPKEEMTSVEKVLEQEKK